VATAQSESAYDLINAVNALRALQGLEPYTVDAGLMAYAQEHSDYQAATNTSTHIHRDGAVPWSIGLQENVAAGDLGVVTVAVVVYQIWSDAGHRHTLTGYATGEIGAGVALTDNDFVYYTVDVRPGEELAATPAPFVPLAKSTPRDDGSVVHIVGFGQTLWEIAVSYGVTIDDIRRLNGIPADSVVIQPGQELLIRAGDRPADPTASSVAELPVVTLAPPTALLLPTEPIQASATPTLLPTPVASDGSERHAGAGVAVALAVAIIGLSIAAVLGFRQAHEDSMSDAGKREGGQRKERPPGGG